MTASMVVAILALGIAIGSIVIRYWESPPETSRRISQLELDLAQSVETVSRWMKRENVRRARDEKEAAESLPTTTLPSSAAADRKAALRQRAREKGLRV